MVFRSRVLPFVAVLGVCWLAYAVATRTAGTEANVYAQKILVANRPGFAPDAIIDKHLLNPWGIALRPPGAGGHFWISNAGNFSTSTYVGDVHGTPLHQDGLKVVYFESPLISYEDGLANAPARSTTPPAICLNTRSSSRCPAKPATSPVGPPCRLARFQGRRSSSS